MVVTGAFVGYRDSRFNFETFHQPGDSEEGFGLELRQLDLAASGAALGITKDLRPTDPFRACARCR